MTMMQKHWSEVWAEEVAIDDEEEDGDKKPRVGGGSPNRYGSDLGDGNLDHVERS